MPQRPAPLAPRRRRAARPLLALALLGLAAVGASPLSSGTPHQAPPAAEQVAVAGR